MSRRRRALTYKWDKPDLNLYLIGDTHIGSEAADEGRIYDLAQIIKADKKAAIIGLGDYIEAIAITDRRFDASELRQPISPEHLSNPFYCQALRFSKLFEATRGKWIALISGNHETTALRNYHVDATQIICDRLGAAYLGGTERSGWVRLQFMRNDRVRASLDIFCIHGYGGGELRGGDALKMQRILGRKQADIVAMAHIHRPSVFPEPFESLDNRGWETTATRWGVINYPMVGKHGYLASRGANAPPPGYIVLEIKRQQAGCKIKATLGEL